MMNGLDVLLIVVALVVFYGIAKSMDAHEAWLNRQPLRDEARKNFQQALAMTDNQLDAFVYTKWYFGSWATD